MEISKAKISIRWSNGTSFIPLFLLSVLYSSQVSLFEVTEKVEPDTVLGFREAYLLRAIDEFKSLRVNRVPSAKLAVCLKPSPYRPTAACLNIYMILSVCSKRCLANTRITVLVCLRGIHGDGMRQRLLREMLIGDSIKRGVVIVLFVCQPSQSISSLGSPL